uniref:Uncharacterized protein n=1 Tax=Kalanchoe fedtschenkoi TaxID=63787 RepID=A0A7N1A416_KALFE
MKISTLSPQQTCKTISLPGLQTIYNGFRNSSAAYVAAPETDSDSKLWLSTVITFSAQTEISGSSDSGSRQPVALRNVCENCISYPI